MGVDAVVMCRPGRSKEPGNFGPIGFRGHKRAPVTYIAAFSEVFHDLPVAQIPNVKVGGWLADDVDTEIITVRGLYHRRHDVPLPIELKQSSLSNVEASQTILRKR